MLISKTVFFSSFLSQPLDYLLSIDPSQGVLVDSQVVIVSAFSFHHPQKFILFSFNSMLLKTPDKLIPFSPSSPLTRGWRLIYYSLLPSWEGQSRGAGNRQCIQKNEISAENDVYLANMIHHTPHTCLSCKTKTSICLTSVH